MSKTVVKSSDIEYSAGFNYMIIIILYEIHVWDR